MRRSLCLGALERRCAARGSTPSPRSTNARGAAPGEHRVLHRGCGFCSVRPRHLELATLLVGDYPYNGQTLDEASDVRAVPKPRACVERGEGAEPLAAQRRSKAANN